MDGLFVVFLTTLSGVFLGILVSPADKISVGRISGPAILRYGSFGAMCWRSRSSVGVETIDIQYFTIFKGGCRGYIANLTGVTAGVCGDEFFFAFAGDNLNMDVILAGKEKTLPDGEVTEAFALLVSELEDVG